MRINRGVATLSVAALGLLASGALASIPEPDHVLFGTVRNGDELVTTGTITLRVSASPDPLASFPLDPASEDHRYVLRVPMDAVDPRSGGAARPGDVATLFLDGEIAGQATIGEACSIQELDLNTDYPMVADLDEDGLTGAQEQALGTDRNNPDSDGDGIPDGYEIANGLNPLSAADAAGDLDGDGLSNLDEYQLGTNPAQSEASAPLITVTAGSRGESQISIQGLDPSGGLAYAITGAPLRGAATVSTTGRVTYLAGARYVGTDRLALSVTDTRGARVAVTVQVNVTASAEPPVPPTLTPEVLLAQAGLPDALAWADWNGDGLLDLAAADADSGQVLIYFGDGWGALALAGAPDAGGSPTHIAAGDLNGDGLPDALSANGIPPGASAQKVARAEALGGTDRFCVLLNQGDGDLVRLGNYSTGGSAVAVALGDVDGDDDLDAVAVDAARNEASVWFGDGSGGLAPGPVYPTGASPAAILLADLDGDDDLDLAVANAGGKTLSIYRGSGTGAFSPLATLGVGTSPAALAVGDLDGDGVPDLVSANRGSPDVSILFGRGDATFQAALHYAVGDTPSAVSVADLDGDGFQDLAVLVAAPPKLVLLMGDGDGSFEPAVLRDLSGLPTSLAAGDVNGDKQLDLAIGDEGATTVSVLLFERDTDGDGMPDGFERSHGLDRLVGDDAGLDPDADDLTNLGEFEHRTDLADPDTDGDGMPDGFEVSYGFDPLDPSDAADVKADPDEDGLTNEEEYSQGTDPSRADTDQDGLPDGWEVAQGLDPLDPEDAGEDGDGDGLDTGGEYVHGTDRGNADTDGDGMSDGWEVLHGLAPLDAGDREADPDEDGLTNVEEAFSGTDPRVGDTDQDGMTDGFEVAYGLDPLSAGDASEDPDGDGLTNREECQCGTDPTSAETSAAAIQITQGTMGMAKITVAGLGGPDGLTYTIEDPPDHGVALVSRTGYVTYIPEMTYHGGDRVTVRVTDAAGVSSRSEVPVSVTAAVDPPNAPVIEPLATYLDAGAPRVAALADMNGDGRADLVAADQSSRKVFVYLARGSGAFEFLGAFDAATEPVDLAVADLDGDRFPDVLVAGWVPGAPDRQRGPEGAGLRRAGDVDVHPIRLAVAVGVELRLHPEVVLDPLAGVLEAVDDLGLTVDEDGKRALLGLRRTEGEHRRQRRRTEREDRTMDGRASAKHDPFHR